MMPYNVTFSNALARAYAFVQTVLVKLPTHACICKWLLKNLAVCNEVLPVSAAHWGRAILHRCHAQLSHYNILCKYTAGLRSIRVSAIQEMFLC